MKYEPLTISVLSDFIPGGNLFDIAHGHSWAERIEGKPMRKGKIIGMTRNAITCRLDEGVELTVTADSCYWFTVGSLPAIGVTIYVQFATSHEMWASLSERTKARYRRRFPHMTDQGIRLRLWRQRNWQPMPLVAHKCNCHKLHRVGCPNTNA